MFITLRKNAIKINLNLENKGELSIGSSKFGGNPDVSKSFEWFYFEGNIYEEEKKNRPLCFLAQINCKEIAEFDQDGLLPATGFLYFFYDLYTMSWGFDPQDIGSAQVFYFDGSESELYRTDFPNDMGDEFQLPEIKLEFSKNKEVPYYEEFMQLQGIEQYDSDLWNKYNKAKEAAGYEQDEEISKLLGYADLIQGGMLIECEAAANGICRDGKSEIEPETLKQIRENCKDWQLLFQLDSIKTDDFELIFCDIGRIYYYIKQEDLKHKIFNNCWLILQSC